MKVTKINDYYEKLYEKFPDVPKSDIQRIVKFGWRSIFLHNSYGGDVFLKDNDLWFYIGQLSNNSIKHFKYYIRKLITKIRILYQRRKIEWDGYYYFALNDSAYENYLKQKNRRGRPKKNFNFGQVFMYQILDECKLAESAHKYIFRIPYITKVHFKFYIPELITDKAELIITREPLKFKDILTNSNEYEFI